jgi:biotin carboxyl carrier protein
MPTEIAAHITETAWKIEAQVGDTVAEGQVLVVVDP